MPDGKETTEKQTPTTTDPSESGTQKGEPDGARDKGTEQKESSESTPDTKALNEEIQALKKSLEAAESKIGEARNESVEERQKRQRILEEQGKFKDLLEEKSAEYESLSSKHEALKEEVKTMKSSLKAYQDRDEVRRKALIGEFPKEQQERYADADRWPLEEIEHLHSLIVQKDGRPQTRDEGGGGTAKTPKESGMQSALRAKIGVG